MWWDERRAGGRVHGWLFLFHPGPSLLVTATFVAVSALAARAAPSALHALHLAGAMLPIQFAIGAANDVVDRGGDAATEPYKPLVRGAMSVPSATAAAVVLAAAGLVSAATINPLTGALCVLGLAAGLSYDLGLRRTVLSVVPWWAGFALLPLAAFAAAGVTTARLLWLLPLTALVALGLHLANGAPDVEGDRRVGRRS